MKKLALVLALTLAAFAGSAYAGWFDNVGIYFDEAATNNCGTMGPYEETPAFMVLTRLTTTDVNAWELALTNTNVTISSFAPRGDTPFDVAQFSGEHMVGLASPIPAVNGAVVVADLLIYVKNTNPANIKVGGCMFHSLPTKVPCFQGSTSGLLELHPISAPGQPIVTINDGCVVATENTTFGSVKGLFR